VSWALDNLAGDLLDALEYAPDGVVITDLRGTITYVNAVFTEMTGYSFDEAVGQNPRILKSGNQDPRIYKELWGTITRGECWRGELINRRKDGSHYTEEMRINPVRDPRGEISSFIAIKRDVTEDRKRQEAQSLLAAIVENADDAIIAFSPEGVIRSWNRGAETLLGYKPEEMIGKHGFAIVPADRQTRMAACLKRVGQGRTLSHYEGQCQRKNGVRATISINGSPIKSADGEVTAIVLSMHDITDRKRTQERLVESEERFRVIADACPAVLWVTDPHGGLQFVNKAYRKFFGKNIEEVKDDKWQVEVHPEDAGAYVGNFLAAVRDRLPYRAEARVRRADGEYRLIGSYGEPRLSASGEFQGHVGLSADITDRKRAEKAVAESQALAQSTIDALSSTICVLDETGKIITVNQAWRNFVSANGRTLADGDWDTIEENDSLGEGSNYLDVCDSVTGECAAEAGAFARGIRAVLQGEQQEFVREYACNSSTEERWFIGRATRFFVGSLPRVVVEHVDISERKRAEAAINAAKLKAEEEARRQAFQYSLIRAIYRVSPNGIVVLSEDGKVISHNEVFPEVWGIPQESEPFVGDGSDGKERGAGLLEAAIASTKDPERFIQRAQELLANPDADDHTEFELKDGRTLECHSSCLRGEKNENMGRVIYFRDITAKKQGIEEVKKSEEKFRQLAENIQECFWIMSPPSPEILYVSPAFEHIWGLSCEELYRSPMLWSQSVIADDRALAQSIHERRLQGEAVEAQYRIRSERGDLKWIRTRSYPVLNGAGETVRIVGVAEDITYRKLGEEALRRSEAEFRTLFETANDQILIVRLEDGRILEANEVGCRRLGYSREELLAMTVVDFDGRPDAGYLVELRAELLANKSCQFETIQIRKDGTRMPVEINTRLLEFRGELAGLCVVRDISERKEAEEANLRAKQAAEEASKAKSQFLANMSHEIRTPLNGIIGMTGLLFDTGLSSEQLHYAEAVRDSGETLLGLVNNVLDFSKIEANKIELEIVDFDLQSIRDDLASIFGAHAHAKGLELCSIVDMELPTYFRGDAGRLRQIMTNLVGNAIKFTDSGEVSVRVSIDEESGGDCLLRYSVRDTGIGIAADKFDNLFDEFSQVETTTTREFGGTGLGLAISKRLVEKMGGEMGVSSEAGKGSEFWFTVRLGRAEAPAGAGGENKLAACLKGLRVLIVDDNATSREIVRTLTSFWEMRPTVVEGGPWALHALYKGLKEDDPYRIAIIDMQMPGMDGKAVGLAIKADPRHAGIGIILMTCVGEHRCKELEEHRGSIGCVTKPVGRRSLLRQLHRLVACAGVSEGCAELAESETAVEAGGRPLRKLAAKARVLVAEDNFTNQEVTLGILKKLGLHADAVENGAEAVKLLETVPYDLVLMDLRMPVLDGLGATRRIRDAGSAVLNHAIPIVAISANVQQSDRDLCAKAGMNGFISKPVSPESIRDAVEQFVVKIGAQEPGHPMPNPLPQSTVAELPVFDREAVLARLMGDEELAAKIVEGFIQETPRLLESMRELAAAGDAIACGRLAHAIKGAAANVGGERLRQVAYEMEKMGEAGDLAGVVERMEGLACAFDALQQAMA